MESKESQAIIRVSGTYSRILEIATQLSRIYENQIIETSKIKKNEKDELFHIFLTIDFNKAPPKEQTDVKVREVW